jgi:hypothetical protein
VARVHLAHRASRQDVAVAGSTLARITGQVVNGIRIALRFDASATHATAAYAQFNDVVETCLDKVLSSEPSFLRLKLSRDKRAGSAVVERGGQIDGRDTQRRSELHDRARPRCEREHVEQRADLRCDRDWRGAVEVGPLRAIDLGAYLPLAR